MEHDASWNEGSKGAELWHGHIQPSDALKGENRKAAISPTYSYSNCSLGSVAVFVPSYNSLRASADPVHVYVE